MLTKLQESNQTPKHLGELSHGVILIHGNTRPCTSNRYGIEEKFETVTFMHCCKISFPKEIVSQFPSTRAPLNIAGSSHLTSPRQPVALSSDLFSVWFGNSSKRSSTRCRFVEWAQNEIGVVPDFHKRILFSDEAHFWLNGYVNKLNCRIWSESNSQVYVETPLHPEKLTVWCALWAGGILLQKR
ncbi:putative transposable element [Trichonephila clavipes]|nr:putative transposable element [Trichonephila clavipes]